MTKKGGTKEIRKIRVPGKYLVASLRKDGGSLLQAKKRKEAR